MKKPELIIKKGISINFKIEEGIPVPKKRNEGRGYEYPWDIMKVGDSFFVKMDVENMTKKEKNKKQSSISTCGRTYFKLHKLNRVITTRNVEGGVRVWRIK
jgi:hypothetical protein